MDNSWQRRPLHAVNEWARLRSQVWLFWLKVHQANSHGARHMMAAGIACKRAMVGTEWVIGHTWLHEKAQKNALSTRGAVHMVAARLGNKRSIFWQ